MAAPAHDQDVASAYSRFSTRQRVVIVSIASIVGLLSPLSSNLYTPAIPAISHDLAVSTAAVNLTITSYLILQGLSPMVWSAIGDSVGRRPLYLATLTIYLGACLGLSLVDSYAGVLVLRALQAAGSASTTAIGAGLIGDLVHVSRRGQYMGNYSALGGVATAIGPVLGGVFAQFTGWHGIFFFLLGLSGFLLLLVVLLVPETMRGIVGDGSIAPPRYLRPPLLWLDAPKTAQEDAHAISRKPFKVDVAGTLRLLTEPEVLCCVIFTGVCYTVWQMSMVATAPLYAEQYGLRELYIGLTYISNGMGSLCASVVTGKLLNREYARQLERERAAGGPEVREVERIERARIRPMIVPTALFLASVVAFGWVVQRRVHIAVSITLAFFVGGLDTCILATFSTLVVDLFQKQSFSVTACMNLSRCLFAAGGTAIIQPLIRAVGVGWAFTLCAVVALFSCPFAWAEWHYGQRWRKARKMRDLDG
ncbi:MFS general substrate transporter [Auricularia subglabra TFB-10046 SS5]|nr:MFS general substrate transporter [Auricularia subglabra TFB-10046 SS5]